MCITKQPAIVIGKYYSKMLMRLLVLSINEHVMTECELCRHCVAGCYLVKTYH